MDKFYDETFLARWADGRLTPEEVKEFEASEAYEEYRLILAGIDNASFPESRIDEDWEELRTAIGNDRSEKTSTGRVIPMQLIYAVAASLLLLVGYRFLFQTVTHTTGLAEHVSIELPDGTLVDLNADSEISYDRFGWNDERSVQLEGEAFFNVIRTGPFKVHTSRSLVTVLGTEFTVMSRGPIAEVECFAGRVSVKFEKEQATELTAGQAITSLSGKETRYDLKEKTPDWKAKESSFEQVPLLYVMEEMERQFGIEIKGKENASADLFTGRFGHSDLEIAARTVFGAMAVPYSIDSKGNINIEPN